MEIQQSPQYIAYIEALGWKSACIDDAYIVFKHFPFIGGLAKMQRPRSLPKAQNLEKFILKNNIKSIAIEPDLSISQQLFTSWAHALPKTIRLNPTKFLPTKTIRIDLQSSEEQIFKRFDESKRRAVRRAIKNNITITQSTHIEDLIKIKNKSAGLFGFITTTGIDKLWPHFSKNNGTILLAYSTRGHEPITMNQCVGGILLLFLDSIAYYWIAGATKKGKKLFAPTLLVWEALKVSKKRGSSTFDFVGVWDERMPNQFTSWKGFTKFKEGFGGKTLYYPIIVQ